MGDLPHRARALADGLRDLGLTSYRYLHRQEKLLPRAIRKLQVARGFMVYEGLR